MRISTMARVVGAAVLTGFLVVLGVGSWTHEKLKIGGERFDRIILGKDLLADILPPPEYVIESFLETTLALKQPDKLAVHTKRLETLKRDYDTRLEFWNAQDLPTNLKSTFLEGSVEPARDMFRVIEEHFLPAIKAGDMAKATEVHDKIQQAYERHRNKIDETVVMANAFVKDIETEAATGAQTELSIVVVVSLSVVVLLIAAIIGSIRGVVTPISGMANAMRELALGNTEIVLPGRDRHDEIGEMAEAADVFRENAIRRAELEREQAAIRDTELERQYQIESIINEFKGRIQRMVESLDKLVSVMRQASSTLGSAADITSQRAAAASGAANGAADNSQTVAQSTEQLNSSIKEIASQAQRTSLIVSEATERARKTDTDVAGLAEATERISSVIELIRTIADQTNLLALNATIESARAGEAGKGFAVVASEVKSLASQTGKATEEIAKQIEDVQAMTRNAVEAIRGISEKVSEIDGLTGAIAAAVEEQDAATREITEHVSSAATKSRNAAQDVDGVSGAADQTRGEAKSVAKTSDEMAAISEDLRKALDRFVADLSSDLKGRRAFWRKTTEWGVAVIVDGVRSNVQAYDVSRSGMRLSYSRPLPKGQSIEIDFGQGPKPASVVWSNGTMLGAKFDVVLPRMPERPTVDIKTAA